MGFYQRQRPRSAVFTKSHPLIPPENFFFSSRYSNSESKAFGYLLPGGNFLCSGGISHGNPARKHLSLQLLRAALPRVGTDPVGGRSVLPVLPQHPYRSLLLLRRAHPPEQLQRYAARFAVPELILRLGERFLVLPYKKEAGSKANGNSGRTEKKEGR